MNKVKFKFHWSFILLSILLICYGLLIPFATYIVTLLLHEFGHFFAANKLGYKLDTVTFMPYGAGLSGKKIKIKPFDEFLIVVAGPLINLIIIVLISLTTSIFGQVDFLHMFLLSNSSTMFFNLLPVYPLDGGRIAYLLLKTKFKPLKAFKFLRIIGVFITATFFIAFFVSYFYELNYMLGINAMFLLIGLFEEDNNIYYAAAYETLNNRKEITL